MPTKPLKRFTAWSYSRLGDYRQCPLRAKLKHIDRIKEPGSPAMDRGALVHESAAEYVHGNLRRIPKDLKLFHAEFKMLKKLHAKTPCMVETQWAFTAAWKPCDWFAKEAWCRMVTDIATPPVKHHMRVIDYKTGRNRSEEQRPQLSLYAVGGFIRYPEVNEINTEFWYTDQGEIVEETFHRQDLKKLQAKWAKEVHPLLKDRTFAPRPTDKCRWCDYSQARQGLCKF